MIEGGIILSPSITLGVGGDAEPAAKNGNGMWGASPELA